MAQRSRRRSMNKSMNKGRSMKRSRGRSMKRRMRGGEEIKNAGPGVASNARPGEASNAGPPMEENAGPGVASIAGPGEASNAGPPMEENEKPGMFDNLFGSVKDSVSETYESASSNLSNQAQQVKDEAGQLVEQGKGTFGSLKDSVLGSDETSVTETSVTEPEKKAWYQIFGGRRRSKSRQMKGGLNQDFGYDAAPVTNANVAQPTYMLTSKGGRRSCKKRRKCCKKSCKKRHRHHHKGKK